MDPSALFSIYLGLATHAVPLDDPEITNFDNPLGTVEIRARVTNRIDAYVRHESSLIRWEEGYGYNTVGVQLRIW